MVKGFILPYIKVKHFAIYNNKEEVGGRVSGRMWDVEEWQHGSKSSTFPEFSGKSFFLILLFKRGCNFSKSAANGTILPDLGPDSRFFFFFHRIMSKGE